jgi:hypothetical protein
MEALGRPRITIIPLRGVAGAWVALDGSHRLEASKRLGLHPIFKKMRGDWLDWDLVRHLDGDLLNECEMPGLMRPLFDASKLASALRRACPTVQSYEY